MRHGLFLLLSILLCATAKNTHAQVQQDLSYQHLVRQAESLLAGTGAGNIPHHIHYDLKYYDRDGHESTATYDIYRQPPQFVRVEINSPTYHLTRISHILDRKDWIQYKGNMPLKIADFEQAFDRPSAAMDRLTHNGVRRTEPVPPQKSQPPLLCAGDDAGTVLCFHPLIRLFYYAQMFNQTILYDQWLPIGTHTVPGAIYVYQGKKLLVQAVGTVEEVKSFPEHFMDIPSTPTQLEQSEMHKVKDYKPAEMSRMIYGSVQVALSVDEQGKVIKADILDSDDKKLEGYARKMARSITFEPQSENGRPVPFETVVYLRYYPEV